MLHLDLRADLDAEEASRICLGKGGTLLLGDAEYLGEGGVRIAEIARMIQRSAKWVRCEVWAIGLDENAVVRKSCGDLLGAAGVGKGEGAREGYHISELDQLSRHIDTARIAVEHATDIRELTDHRHYVGVGLAVVDADGQIQALGELHLLAEVAMLTLLVGVGIVVIKTYFTKADTLSALVFYHIFDFCEICIHVRKKACVARVNAEGEVHIVILLGLRDGGAAGLGAGADVDDSRDVARKKSADQRISASLSLLNKTLVVIMRMRIKVFHQ